MHEAALSKLNILEGSHLPTWWRKPICWLVEVVEQEKEKVLGKGKLIARSVIMGTGHEVRRKPHMGTTREDNSTAWLVHPPEKGMPIDRVWRQTHS